VLCVTISNLYTGLGVLTAVVMKNYGFWDITPCKQLNVNKNFEGICRLHLQGRRKAKQETSMTAGVSNLDSYLAYSSTVKMEATCSSETSVDFQRTTRRYILEDRNI
jgi:hypothetical protein